MVFSLGQILSISCFLTGIVMMVFVLGILLTMRFGQQWLTSIVERFTNPAKNKEQKQERQQTVAVVQQPQVASSQALRQRAQSLDFPAPAAGFAAQTALPQDSYGQQQTGYQHPAQASFRARDQYPAFNPQASQPQQTQSFQPTMPSLSPSRPFQGGNVLPPSQPQYPQHGGFPQAPQQGGLQPLRPQAPQQAGYPQQPQQGGLQPLRPQSPQAPQQAGFQQQPLQGGVQPLRPQAPQQAGFQQQGIPPQQPLAPRPAQNFQQQGNFGQQAGFQQQGIPPQQPQQGGLGDYRPALNNTPRPDLGSTQGQRPLRRDHRRQDVDEGGILDGAGDILDDAGNLLGF